MIEQVIRPREAVLTGDLRVRRILPFRKRRMVGPFTFLDEMGPIRVEPGHSGDVPPHPHIGLSTVTWLFEGEFIHRDSLGNVQKILPGELNWMTAGRGVVHSERIPAELREKRGDLHGIQAWVALPLEAEETEPNFYHFGKHSLPAFDVNGCSIRLIVGEAFGHTSPVPTYSKLFYLEARLREESAISFDPDGQEAAFYLIRGEVSIDGQSFQPPALVVFERGAPVLIRAKTEALGMLLGGDPLEGHRTIWWNFVSSSKERIEEAKRRWKAQAFPPVPDESEYIPLPDTQLAREKSTMP